MKILLILLSIISFTACQFDKSVKNTPVENSPKLTEEAKQNTKQILPNKSDWQFEKFINVTDNNLKKLQANAMVSFTHRPETPNVGVIYVYSGCNHTTIPIKFDDENSRVIKLNPENDSTTLSTTIGCGNYHTTESAIIEFFSHDNTYKFVENSLVVTDKKGQIIQFKPQAKYIY